MNYGWLFSILFSVFCMTMNYHPSSSAADDIFPVAKPGCKDKCGIVSIPYPFGIGSNCALNESYVISCQYSAREDSSKPYLSKLNLEVLDISLWDQTITINSPVPSTCDNRQQGLLNGTSSWNSTDLAGTPFFFSQKDNILMFFGCGNVLLNQKQGSQVLSGCTSMCKINSNVTGGCYGVNCCETSIPYYLTYYELRFVATELNHNSCASALLADQSWKPERLSESFAGRSFAYFPVVLVWTLPNASELFSIQGCVPEGRFLQVNQTDVAVSYKCECQKSTSPNGSFHYMYNPYLDGSCQYVSQFQAGPAPLTAYRKNWAPVIVGATAGAGVPSLMVVLFALYKILKSRQERRCKQKFFKRNGGLLLQLQLSAHEGIIRRMIIFSANELIKASNGFHRNRILGQGGQGTVYKGMLSDGMLVAIKKSKKVSESQLEQFINEVVILSQVNHRNVVKLLGCCLETEVPLLVYEFIPNGTLFDLIHNPSDEFPLTWNLRLRIATEIAGALAYLHSAIAIPIFHRDIKSSNILLDEKYRAKVSDFGTSRSVDIEKTHLTTQVRGTFGYLDPEYFQSSQFTEKSDVYSFGVVLVELLTSKKAVFSAESGEDDHLGLAAQFLTCMDAKCLDTILDPQVLDQSNEEEIIAVAKLAQRCLNLERKRRPAMKEVAIELENIRIAKEHTSNHETIQSSRYIEEGESLGGFDTDATSTTGSDQVYSS